MKYSYKKTIVKATLQLLVFAIPILLQILPSDIANLTMGAALSAILNWAKHNMNLPKGL